MDIHSKLNSQPLLGVKKNFINFYGSNKVVFIYETLCKDWQNGTTVRPNFLFYQNNLHLIFNVFLSRSDPQRSFGQRGLPLSRTCLTSRRRSTRRSTSTSTSSNTITPFSSEGNGPTTPAGWSQLQRQLNLVTIVTKNKNKNVLDDFVFVCFSKNARLIWV